MSAGTARVLVASNRGPVAFGTGEDGGLVLRRGSGGLVSGLQQVAAEGSFAEGELLWVCAALGDADRRAARAAPHGRLDLAGHDTGGAAVHMLDIDRVVFERAYNAIANRTLWFVSHLLFAPALQPSFGPAFRRDWEAYQTYNALFAEAVAEEAAPGATVLIQDYHLALAAGQLRKLRPDLRIAHFSHTPWAPPEYFRMLPDDVAAAVCEGMLGADRLGFLTEAWASAFRDCCQGVLGAKVDATTVSHLGRDVVTAVHALGVDREALLARAARTDVVTRTAELTELADGRRLIVRVDRTELSKNIVRGLEAYRELLREYPQWREQVVHLVCAYPSRHDLPEYREYTAAVQRIAAEIEDEFATERWLPLRLEVTDDYPRSLAALSMADVLVVNPIRDGMNLIAKEGPVLSRRAAVLILSREAGACAELSDDALVVNPYDVSATAAAMHTALTMPGPERRRRSEGLVAAAGRLPPQAWFADQLNALMAMPVPGGATAP